MDSAALDDCHLAAHEIGQAAWLLHAASTNHLSLTMLAATARHVLSMCSSVCLSGCIHAVLAQALAAALRMSDLARVADSPLQTANFLAFLSDLCSADSISHYLAPTYGRPLTAVEVEREGWDCAHGIGHGFGSGVVRSRLLEIETAWRLCLDAGNRVCVGAGLMMEMVDARVEAAEASAAMAASDHGGMSGSDDGGGGEASIARYGVCESLLVGSWQATCFEGTCHPTCYYNLGEAIMFAACHDRAVALRVCEALPAAAADVSACAMGAGNEADTPEHIAAEDPVMRLDVYVASAAELLAVVPCETDAPSRGCCGDGTCEWLETTANCAIDCAPALPPPPVLPPMMAPALAIAAALFFGGTVLALARPCRCWCRTVLVDALARCRRRGYARGTTATSLRRRAERDDVRALVGSPDPVAELAAEPDGQL